MINIIKILIEEVYIINCGPLNPLIIETTWQGRRRGVKSGPVVQLVTQTSPARGYGGAPVSNRCGTFRFLGSNGSSISNCTLIFSIFCQNSSKSFSLRKPSTVFTVNIAISCPSMLDRLAAVVSY